MRILLVISLVVLLACNGGNSSQEKEKTEIELLNEQVRNAPSDPQAYIDRASYHMDQRSFQDALNDLKRSLVLDSNNADVFLMEGRAYGALQESAKAKFAFLKAIEKDENNKEARLELAQYYGALTNYDRALEYVNDVLKMDDQYARAYFIKGLLYRKGGVDSLAISSIQTAIELDPNTIDPFIFLGDIFGERNDPLALDYYNSALTIDQTNQQALYSKAFFLQNNGRGRESLNTYAEISAIDSLNPIIPYNMGYVYLEVLNQPDSSAIHFSKALKLSPQYYQAYYNRGLCYERLGEIEEARLDYKAALTISHNYPLAIEGLNRLDKMSN